MHVPARTQPTTPLWIWHLLGVLALVSVWLVATPPAVAQEPLTLDTPIEVTAIALRVREAPGLGAPILGTVLQGAKGAVVNASPHWSDGYWWWEIAYRNGLHGWSADGDADLVYLVIDSYPEAPETLQAAPGTTPDRVPSAAGGARGSLTIVVIPSIMSALSLARADLVVVLDGPESHVQRIPSVAPAFPVTVVFDDIAPGTYRVSAQHGGSRLSREISVQGSTLQVDFVMQ